MSLFKDQTGRKIEIADYPQRIISLVPSQTELLFDLGLEERIIGLTKFCIHPESLRRKKTIVGGTKNFKPELIRALKPDLIIANKEENDELLLTSLMKEFPVWISDISNLFSAMEMINSVGDMTNTHDKTMGLINEIKKEFDDLEDFLKLNSITTKRVAYFIWQKPWMSIGNDTFIADMLRKCGLIPVFENENRYPEITMKRIIDENPDVIFLSSEPFPFKQKHIFEMAENLPQAKVVLVNGEYFSWYGSRLKRAPEYFKMLLSSLK
jgi:ABC-type Fe3+-hydroxamate transport system substrate-binding protein